MFEKIQNLYRKKASGFLFRESTLFQFVYINNIGESEQSKNTITTETSEFWLFLLLLFMNANTI